MPTLTLESTVYTLQQLLDVPEAQVALAGRSNVGKSSLINALAVPHRERRAPSIFTGCSPTTFFW